MNLETLQFEDGSVLEAAQPLLEVMLKAVPDSKDEWAFHGIASDESEDVEGDTLLKKSLDLSYAQRRGYVNWNHSKDPGDQLGFLEKAELLEPGLVAKLEDEFEVPLSKSSTVYMKGKLYPHMKKAVEARDLMKSVKEVGGPGLGMSLEGALGRNKSGGIVKAYVRGVALTHRPVNVNTICSLIKSLRDYSTGQETATPEVQAQQMSGAADAAVVAEALAKATKTGMSFDEAVLWVLKQRPSWSYDLATKVVRYTMTKSQGD